MRFLKKCQIVLFLMLSVCSLNAFAQTKTSGQVLKFTAIPDQNTTELKEKFALLANELSAKLATTVEYVPSRDYQASVEMFKNGDVDFAWFGGLTGVQARAAVSGSQAIAQGSADPKYISYFIANANTGLSLSEKFPLEIAQYSFTFGSASSTSGRLMPEYFIRQQTKKSPEEFFQKPVGFSGSHDKTAELVATGQYQVGALNFKVYDDLVKKGKLDANQVKIIWKTPEYADYNWTSHPQVEVKFGKGFTEKLQTALVSIDKPEVLAAILREKLIPAKNEDFDGIVKVATDLNMLR
jgi:phosphonate transport system substrate-binding protein